MASDSESDFDVFGDSGDEMDAVLVQEGNERAQTYSVNDAVVRFVAGERKNQFSLIYAGCKLYQKAVTEIRDDNEDLRYTEVMYRCQKPKCQKRVWTSIAVASQIQTVTGHNHEGEPTRMEVLLIVDRALNLADQNPLATNKDVIASALEGASDEVRFAVNTKSIGHRLTLFKQKFSISTSCSCDGTFFTRPPGWRQLYVFHMRVKNTFIPAVTVFMAEKSEESYYNILRAIGRLIQESFDRRWIVLNLMTDFEIAIRNAASRYFGVDIDHRSCYFHYSYSLSKKLKKLGLKGMINRDAAFNAYIREFRILPLLPLHRVVAAFKDLINLNLPHRSQWQTVPRIDEFFIYMSNTWIGETTALGIRRPTFLTQHWNHNDALMQDNPKSISVLEAWHRSLNAELRKRRSHPYWSVHCIIRDEIAVHSKQRYFEQFSTTSTRPNRRASQEQVSLLQQAVTDYDPTSVNMSLMRIAQAAFSNRWNNLVALQSQPNALQEQQVPQLTQPVQNIVGINRNPNMRRKRAHPINPASRPLPTGGLNQVRNR